MRVNQLTSSPRVRPFLLGLLLPCFLVGSAIADTPSAATRTIPVKNGALIQTDWFDGSACDGGSSAAFYFQVGEVTFQAPPKDVTIGALGESSQSKTQSGGLVSEIPLSAGCKSRPLELAMVEFKSDDGPNSSIQLKKIPPRTGPVPQVTKYIQHIEKTKGCKKVKDPNLAVCAGSKDRGQVAVKFFVVLEDDGSVKATPSGVPLHARCESIKKSPLVCFIAKQLSGNVGVRDRIDLNDVTAERIRKLGGQMDALVAKHRVQ